MKITNKKDFLKFMEQNKKCDLEKAGSFYNQVMTNGFTIDNLITIKVKGFETHGDDIYVLEYKTNKLYEFNIEENK